MSKRSAAEFVTEKLDDHVVLLRTRSVRVLDDEDDTRAVHDLRVAIRKTRVLLKIGRGLVGSFWAGEIRARLADVQKSTSALRDEEVLQDTLAQISFHDPLMQNEFDQWRAGRNLRARSLRTTVKAQLANGQLERGCELLDSLLRLPTDPKHDKKLERFASKAVRKKRDAVAKCWDTRLTDPESLHRLRIACKELRYAAEIFDESLPVALASLAKIAERFQKRLGDIHDVDVATAIVEIAELSSDVQTRAVTSLHAMRRSVVHRYNEEVEALMRD